MKAQATSRVDGQGRIVIPGHIRKAANLAAGTIVTVDLDSDGTIRVEKVIKK